MCITRHWHMHTAPHAKIASAAKHVASGSHTQLGVRNASLSTGVARSVPITSDQADFLTFCRSNPITDQSVENQGNREIFFFPSQIVILSIEKKIMILWMNN